MLQCFSKKGCLHPLWDLISFSLRISFQSKLQSRSMTAPMINSISWTKFPRLWIQDWQDSKESLLLSKSIRDPWFTMNNENLTRVFTTDKNPKSIKLTELWRTLRMSLEIERSSKLGKELLIILWCRQLRKQGKIIRMMTLSLRKTQFLSFVSRARK